MTPAERLKQFIRAAPIRLGCQILSKGDACECPLCDVDRLSDQPSPAPAGAPQRLTCVRCLKLVDVADAPGIGPYCVECGCDGFVEAGCPPEPVPVSPPAAGEPLACLTHEPVYDPLCRQCQKRSAEAGRPTREAPAAGKPPRECDQCGQKDWPGWQSDRCPSIPYGSCDGTLRPSEAPAAGGQAEPPEMRELLGGVLPYLQAVAMRSPIGGDALQDVNALALRIEDILAQQPPPVPEDAAPEDGNVGKVAIVEATLRIAKDHWLKTGTAIRPEDAALVAADIVVLKG